MIGFGWCLILTLDRLNGMTPPQLSDPAPVQVPSISSPPLYPRGISP
jgi:hypothetical protein